MPGMQTPAVEVGVCLSDKHTPVFTPHMAVPVAGMGLEVGEGEGQILLPLAVHLEERLTVSQSVS